MATPIGPLENPAASQPGSAVRLKQAKKKGCKKSKCSHWKGGKCRCGRD